MNYRSSIHSRSLLIKSVAGNFLKWMGDLDYPSHELIVLNYHSTPEIFSAEFEKQVQFIEEKFQVITPKQLADYYKGTLQTEKCALLFTFDDGLKNNLIASGILEKYGMKAYFFVVPEFIETHETKQKEYYLRNIRPVVNPEVDREPDDFHAMNWSDIHQLLQSGHSVGSHTATHTLVAAHSSAHNSLLEIRESKTKLEEKTGVAIEAFCSINNTLESIGAREKSMIAENYSLHFTTLPGLNSASRNSLFIKRRNVECFWPTGAFYYALGKNDLKRWSARIRQYEVL